MTDRRQIKITKKNGKLLLTLELNSKITVKI